MSTRELTITKLRRESGEEFWRANVTGPDGVTVAVDRQFGSWQGEVRTAKRSREFERRDVLAYVAAALQAKVRPIERREVAA